MAALGIQSMFLPTSYGGASIEWVNGFKTTLWVFFLISLVNATFQYTMYLYKEVDYKNSL